MILWKQNSPRLRKAVHVRTWNTQKITSPKSQGIASILPVEADTHLEELVVKETEKLSCASLNRTLSIWLE